MPFELSTIRQSVEGTQAVIAWGQEKTRHWLGILDQHIIGFDADHECLNTLIIADFFGAGLASRGEAVRLDYSECPNVDRWLRGMKRMPK